MQRCEYEQVADALWTEQKETLMSADNIVIRCPQCGKKLKAPRSKIGFRSKCPGCGNTLLIAEDQGHKTTEIASTQKNVTRVPPQNMPRPVPKEPSPVKTSDRLSQLNTDVIVRNIETILTPTEKVLVACEQTKPIAIKRDAVVLTERRFILYRPKLLGRMDFQDAQWKDLIDVHLSQNMLGSTISFRIEGNRVMAVDWLAKKDAMKVYSIAQEKEEIVREERRQRQMQEDRARSGGIDLNIGTPGSTGSTEVSSVADRLIQLTKLYEAGAITPSEFESKRAELISKL